MNIERNGFTLVELMITIAIVGILTAIAIPMYANHIRRAYYTEVMQATEAYRISVYNCIVRQGVATGCSAGTQGIPNAISSPIGSVNTLSVTDGVITVTPIAAHGITAADDYVLTPTYDTTSGIVTWSSSGGGVTAGYGT